MSTITRISTTRRPVAGPDDVADDTLFREYRETGDRRVRNELIESTPLAGDPLRQAVRRQGRAPRRPRPGGDARRPQGRRAVRSRLRRRLRHLRRPDHRRRAAPPLPRHDVGGPRAAPGQGPPAHDQGGRGRAGPDPRPVADGRRDRRPGRRARRGRARRARGRPLLPQDPARDRLRRRPPARYVDIGPSARTSGGSTRSRPPPPSSSSSPSCRPASDASSSCATCTATRSPASPSSSASARSRSPACCDRAWPPCATR